MAQRINVTITLPPEVWRQVRAAAALRGIAASRITEHVLREWLERLGIDHPVLPETPSAGAAGDRHPNAESPPLER